jgi:hypothetical protein
MKRVLIWGSFVTFEPEPNDLDYSLTAGVYLPEGARSLRDPRDQPAGRECRRATMTIDDDSEARAAYENLVRMYSLCDRIAADTTGHPETRKDEIEGVQAMVRKIERQLLGYLTRKYASDPAPRQTEHAEIAA